jgi:hypothetical protein
MSRNGGGLWSAVAWLAFPLVPALLAQAYHRTLNFNGADPREWETGSWFILLGPLCGYGFLAGATIGIPDVPGRRGVRALLSRRSVWVGVGPWSGFLLCAGIAYAMSGVEWLLDRAWPGWNENASPTLWQGWWGDALIWGAIGVSSYGWLAVGFAALRRARRVCRLGVAIRRGLAVAIGFVGSLVGSFWAATEVWRSYFFDPTVLRLALVAVVGLTTMSGCGPTTVGEARRREFFGAMLMAWVLGLSLAWRWWARSRPPAP